MVLCFNVTCSYNVETLMKLYKFGAVWCPGCLVMKPRWKEIEAENPWLETRYFDYDTSKEMVDKFNIGKVLPVFVFLDKNNKEITRLIGEVSKDSIMRIVRDNKDL